MTKKKIIIWIICIVAFILIVVAGVLIKNKLNEDRKNSMATYQLNTASAWSIKYNKNPNFTVELIEGNLLKVEAIGGESTIKITCSDEKNEEITIVAKYTKQDGIKISKDGENTEMRVNVKVGEKVFSAILYDNSATKSLISKLPLKMKMNELNGNEKYYNLDYSLPTTSVKPEKINTGDIMLYTSNCLVIFYDTFNTNYSYTKIGYIEDVNGLKEALGDDSVEVEITLE
mgnify:FL=1